MKKLNAVLVLLMVIGLFFCQKTAGQVSSITIEMNQPAGGQFTVRWENKTDFGQPYVVEVWAGSQSMAAKTVAGPQVVSGGEKQTIFNMYTNPQELWYTAGVRLQNEYEYTYSCNSCYAGLWNGEPTPTARPTNTLTATATLTSTPTAIPTAIIIKKVIGEETVKPMDIAMEEAVSATTPMKIRVNVVGYYDAVTVWSGEEEKEFIVSTPQSLTFGCSIQTVTGIVIDKWWIDVLDGGQNIGDDLEIKSATNSTVRLNISYAAEKKLWVTVCGRYEDGEKIKVVTAKITIINSLPLASTPTPANTPTPAPTNIPPSPTNTPVEGNTPPILRMADGYYQNNTVLKDATLKLTMAIIDENGPADPIVYLSETTGEVILNPSTYRHKKNLWTMGIWLKTDKVGIFTATILAYDGSHYSEPLYLKWEVVNQSPTQTPAPMPTLTPQPTPTATFTPPAPTATFTPTPTLLPNRVAPYALNISLSDGSKIMNIESSQKIGAFSGAEFVLNIKALDDWDGRDVKILSQGCDVTPMKISDGEAEEQVNLNFSSAGEYTYVFWATDGEKESEKISLSFSISLSSTPTPTVTPAPTSKPSPTATPPPLKTGEAMAVIDNSQGDAEINILWDMPTTDVKVWHIYVFQDADTQPQYLGWMSPDVNYIWWNKSNVQIDPLFKKEGPKSGITYRFEVRGVNTNKSKIVVCKSNTSSPIMLINKVIAKGIKAAKGGFQVNIGWDQTIAPAAEFWDVWLSVDDEAYKYLGQIINNMGNVLEWKQNNPYITENFRTGPQLDLDYKFLVYPLSSQRKIISGPFPTDRVRFVINTITVGTASWKELDIQYESPAP